MLMRSDRPAEALRFAEAARALGLHTPEQDILMAACHAKLGQDIQAEDILKSALSQWPGSLPVAEEMALFLISRERADEAKAVLGKLLEQDDASSEIRLKLSALCMLDEKYEEAETMLVADIQRHPDHLPSLYQLGLLCERQNRLDEARGWYMKALGLNAADPQTRRALRRLRSAATSKSP